MRYQRGGILLGREFNQDGVDYRRAVMLPETVCVGFEENPQQKSHQPRNCLFYHDQIPIRIVTIPVDPYHVVFVVTNDFKIDRLPADFEVSDRQIVEIGR